jgi:hypothetical protein
VSVVLDASAALAWVFERDLAASARAAGVRVFAVD